MRQLNPFHHTCRSITSAQAATRHLTSTYPHTHNCMYLSSSQCTLYSTIHFHLTANTQSVHYTSKGQSLDACCRNHMKHINTSFWAQYSLGMLSQTYKKHGPVPRSTPNSSVTICSYRCVKGSSFSLGNILHASVFILAKPSVLLKSSRLF